MTDDNDNNNDSNRGDDGRGDGNALIDDAKSFIQRARAALDELEKAAAAGKQISGFYILNKETVDRGEGVREALSTAGCHADDMHTNTAFRIACGVIRLPVGRLAMLMLRLVADPEFKQYLGLDVIDSEEQQKRQQPGSEEEKADADDCDCPICQIRRALTGMLPAASPSTSSTQSKPAGPDPGAPPTEEEMAELLRMFGDNGPNSVN